MNIRFSELLLIILILSICHFRLAVADVSSFYGIYDASNKPAGLPADSLSGPVRETWLIPEIALKDYRVAILIPQLTDTWIAFSNGAISQATSLGMKSVLYAEKSYLSFGDQQRHLRALKGKVDGIIIGSISYKKMDRAIAEMAAEGIPVIAMANDVYAPAISGKSLVSFFDMGYRTGRYLAENITGDNQIQRVAFLPGPEGAGWSSDSWDGFRQALKDTGISHRVRIVNDNGAMWGDTRVVKQQKLVQSLLKNNMNIDWLIGNAVAASIAADLKSGYLAEHPKLKVLSTYINPDVYRHILAGSILAAACDFPVRQGQYAADLLLYQLEQQRYADRAVPFRVGPEIHMVTHDNPDQFSYQDIFGPEDLLPSPATD